VLEDIVLLDKRAGGVSIGNESVPGSGETLVDQLAEIQER